MRVAALRNSRGELGLAVDNGAKWGVVSYHELGRVVTVEDFRCELDEFRERVDREALEVKDSYRALDRLHALYRRLIPDERGLADEVISGWVLSDDEGKRFDAMALVREFRVRRAVPALQQLVRRLEGSHEPGAPFEREKAKGLIAELSGDTASTKQDGGLDAD